MKSINQSENFIVYASTIDFISCEYNSDDKLHGADKI